MHCGHNANESELSSQKALEPGDLDNGLRILARIIARRIVGKRLAQTTKNGTDHNARTPKALG